MKVGSIVECVDNKNFNAANLYYGMVIPKLNQPYTIREIVSFDGEDGIYLEEIINPIFPKTGKEFGYKFYRFRELLPPMEIQNALDECEPVLIELNKK